MSEYHIIGTPISKGDDPPVFELIIDSHVNHIDPKLFNVDEESINPADFFVTSGDAIQKTKYLKQCFEKLALVLKEKCLLLISEEEKNQEKVLNIFNKNLPDEEWSHTQSYYNAINKNISKTAELVRLLEEAKGSNVFMETEWNNHHLLCIPKNPRKAM